MPELPEVESARRVLVHALDREITAVDDTDHWVCRPHAPGAIAAALVGGRLTAAHRRGKTMWCETSGRSGEPGPHLGVHLGMGGRVIVTDTFGAAHRRRPRAAGPQPAQGRVGPLHHRRSPTVGSSASSTSAGSDGCASTPTSTPSDQTPRRSHARSSGPGCAAAGRR